MKRLILLMVAFVVGLSFSVFAKEYDTGTKSVKLLEVKGRKGTLEFTVKVSDLKKYVDEMVEKVKKEAQDPSLKGMKKKAAEARVNLYLEKQENLSKKPVYALAIGGTMNGWNPAENIMKKVDSDTWKLKLEDVRLGDFIYKFVVYHKDPFAKDFDQKADMTWVEDPFNNNKQPDGFDGYNSVLDLSKFKEGSE
ncbi:MAG: hypothetical protein ACP5QP_05390 [Brevinematia bacterium]